MTSILTTGGAGFISSHTCLVLLEAGHRLLVLDNFSNSSAESLRRVAELAGPGAGERLVVVEGDIRSAADLERAFAAANQVGSAIEAVINFAGLKTVGELLQYPLRYWDISLGGSLQLLAAMQSNGSCILVFSSRAISYGIPEKVPIPETVPIQPINPCGHSKAAVEQLLADLAARRLGLRTRRGLAPSREASADAKNCPGHWCSWWDWLRARGSAGGRWLGSIGV
jgi:UDP-glucose 4-epimerase